MAAIIHTTEAPQIEAGDESAILVLKSGDTEHRFYLSFHNLCFLLQRSREGVNAVCDTTREAEVIPFVREADGKRAARRK